MIAAALGLPLALAIGLAVLDGRRRAVGGCAVAGLCATLLLLGTAGWRVFTQGPFEVITGGWPEGLGIRLRVDALGIVFALVSVAVLLGALAREYSTGIGWRAVPALVTFVAFGMIGLCITADAFNFYVFFEVAMTGAIALSAYSGAAREFRAALVFAIVNSLGSALFLSAIAALYHMTGTLDMPRMAAAAAGADRGALLPIAAVLFVAFGLKLGIFPFHFWVPTVYRDTAPMVAAILSGAIANIGSFGLLRFGSILSVALDQAGAVLIAIGGASILYGSLLALSRPLVAEVLAYSSVAQAGYILLALGLGSPVGLAAAVVYAAINSVIKGLLFLTDGLSGTAAGAAFLLGALSVAGVPPTVGFFGKAAMFRAALDRGAVLSVVVLAAGSLLSLGYMSGAYRRRVLLTPEWQPAPAGARAALAAMGLVILGVGVWPEPLLRAGQAAAQAILVLP